MITTAIAPPTISFSIKECKCTHFSLTEFGKKNKYQFAHDKYEFTYNVTLKIVEQQELMLIDIASVLKQLDEPKEVILELNSSNTFSIPNYKSILIKIGDNPPGIPDVLIATLLGIALSSLRGMYSVKLEGSKYSNAVMPALDMGQFMSAMKQVPA